MKTSMLNKLVPHLVSIFLLVIDVCIFNGHPFLLAKKNDCGSQGVGPDTER